MPELIGRTKPLFDKDVKKREPQLREIIFNSKFLVLGGAGSIGQAVVKEIFKNEHLNDMRKVSNSITINELQNTSR